MSALKSIFRLLFLTLCLAACAQVSELSDEAELRSVQVREVQPLAARVGTPVVTGDKVEIPLEYGKYLFPITLKLHLDMAGNIDKALGWPEDGVLAFDSYEDIKSFNLIAPSGVPHRYRVCLTEVPLSEAAEIEHFEIQSAQPAHFLYTRNVVFNKANSSIDIYGIGEGLPFTVTPSIIVSEGATVAGYGKGDSFTFDAFDTEKQLTVTAASGLKRIWTIRFLGLREIRTRDQVDPDIWDRLCLTPENTGSHILTEGVWLHESIFDADAGLVRYITRPKFPAFPLTLRVTPAMGLYTQILGYDPGGVLSFAGWDTTRHFYLADVLSGTAKPWTLQVQPWLNTAAEVESFELMSYTSSDGSMLLADAVVEPQSRRIVLPVREGFSFPLQVACYRMQISEDAAHNLPAAFTFNRWDTVIPFTVTASDGTPVTWELALRVTLPGCTDVAAFCPRAYHNAAGDMVLGETSIVAADARIVLPITAGIRFPLTVEAYRMDLPFYAAADLPPSVRFEHYADTHSFTVRALNGDTRKWTLALQPWFRTGCELLDFTAGSHKSVEGRVRLGATEVDKTRRTVVIEVTAGYDFPLTLEDVHFSLSEGARVVEDYSAGMVFESIGSKLSLTVEAQSEVDRSSWEISLSDRRTQSHEAQVTDYVVHAYSGTSVTPHNLVLAASAKIDMASATVTLMVTDWGNKLPLKLEGELKISKGAVWVGDGLRLHHEVVFTGYDEEFPFTIESESGMVRKRWTLKLCDVGPDRASACDLVACEFVGYTAAEKNGHTMQLADAPTIDTLSRRIIYEVLDWADRLPLHIRQHITVSEGASVVPAYMNGLHTMEFASLTQVQEFAIYSENGRCVQRWTVEVLNHAADHSMEADLDSFRVLDYAGTTTTAHNMVLDTLPVIDAKACTVGLRITDWSNRFPLTVHTAMTYSEEAEIEHASFGKDGVIRFHSLEERHGFDIVSANGKVRKHWEVYLINEAPVYASAAEVTDFVTGPPEAGFTFLDKYLEPNKHAITLLVSQRPAGATRMHLAPRVSVSKGAKLGGITSGAQMELHFHEPVSFTVTAEDETVSHWTLTLLYAPQIPNSDFELWESKDGVNNLWPGNGTGWTTGNNSQVSGTMPAAGYRSPTCAKMLTQLKTMNFVIYQITSLAAGAVMVGHFELKTNARDVYNPSSMSYIGIPFTVDTPPVGYELYYKYHNGGRRQFTEPKWSQTLIPGFEKTVNIDGEDKALICVDLVYSDAGSGFRYDIFKKTGQLGTGAYLSGQEVGEWTRLQVPLEAVPGQDPGRMTHIAIRMTSSYEGHYFKGADKSALCVDDFKLLYYIPSDADVVTLK